MAIPIQTLVKALVDLKRIQIRRDDLYQIRNALVETFGQVMFGKQRQLIEEASIKQD